MSRNILSRWSVVFGIAMAFSFAGSEANAGVVPCPDFTAPGSGCSPGKQDSWAGTNMGFASWYCGNTLYQMWFRIENGRRTGHFCTSTFTQVQEDDGSPLYMGVDLDSLVNVGSPNVSLIPLLDYSNLPQPIPGAIQQPGGVEIPVDTQLYEPLPYPPTNTSCGFRFCPAGD